jgi:hypothetical protein
MCQGDLGIQNAGCHRNLESCNAEYVYVSNLVIQYAVYHRNLERCNTKFFNVSEEFRNTEFCFSQEFREM